MAKRRKFLVYLAGPISGCNEAQRNGWREEVKRKYAAHFNFSDPAADLLGRKATPYEIVQADLEAIENADGMIVNMWRESIGSAMGIVHAQRAGRPVVAADPNRIRSRMVSFYADVLTDDPLKAAKSLLAILRAETNWRVVKTTPGVEEPFERQKLVNALRAACRGAEQDEIVVPRLALPLIIEKLKSPKRKIGNRVTSTDIYRAVMATFRELEADNARAPAVRGILEHWRHTREAGSAGPINRISETDRESGYGHTDVSVSCGPKSHATIWGKTVRSIPEIPSTQARRVFRAITGVPGITRITLGPFSGKERRNSTGASVSLSSTTANVLDGRLFDKGEKGTLQTFQVWVQRETDRPTVQQEIVNTLKDEGLWRE